MVTAPYSADNEVVGVIGVIGPTRMAYERVIPIVDVTAKILGARARAALNSRRSPLIAEHIRLRHQVAQASCHVQPHRSATH